MKKNFYLFGSLVCLLLTACSPDEPLIQGEDSAEARSEKTELQSSGFQVSRAMVDKFLRITKKEKSVEAVVPMVRQGDTLAYYVQYAKGWDIISGDTRFAPVMIQSEDAPLDLINDNPNKDAVNGLLAYIQDTRKSNEGKEYGLWKLFKPQKKNGNEVLSRSQNGLGQGMWRSIDTIYEQSETIIPHMIAEKWAQTPPWNSFTPYRYGANGYLVPTSTGCIPVVAGQIIHHFRRVNPHGYQVPNLLSPGANPTDCYTVVSTDTCWNSLAVTLYDDENANTDVLRTAMFLAYLGANWNIIYNADGTSVGSYTDFMSMLQTYGISYSLGTNYSPIDILTYLRNHRIVVCMSPYTLNGQSREHAFIIDAYKKQYECYKAIKVWDEEYRYSEWELNNYPIDDFFGPSGHDDNEIETVIYESYDESIAMNWGTGGFNDNTYYVTHIYADGYRVVDEAGEFWVNSVDNYYQPYWNGGDRRYTSVSRYFYNLYDNTH